MVMKVDFRKNDKINPRIFKEGVVRVGFFDTAKYDDDTYVAQVARWNEFGIGVPERPFMRPAVFEKKAELNAFLRSKYKQAIKDKKDTMKVLRLFGEEVVKDIQSQIWNGHYVRNAPSTIARKGRNKPLIDTEFMVNNVNYKAEEVKGL